MMIKLRQKDSENNSAVSIEETKLPKSKIKEYTHHILNENLDQVFEKKLNDEKEYANLIYSISQLALRDSKVLHELKKVIQAIEKNDILFVTEYYGLKTRISQEDIIWIKVNRNYLYIQTRTKYYIENTSLTRIALKLNDTFIRIHKSTMVNKYYIKKINLSKNQILLFDNSVLQIGRSYKSHLVKVFFQEA